jgi:hypothetical protein
MYERYNDMRVTGFQDFECIVQTQSTHVSELFAVMLLECSFIWKSEVGTCWNFCQKRSRRPINCQLDDGS